MSTRSCALSSLLAVACTAFAAEPEPPRAQLERVTVEVPAPAPARVDVRAACPDVDARLQQTLSSAWGDVGKAGTLHVRFRVEGDRVTDVHSSGVSHDYQPYVRKAVRRLACRTASAQPQEYRFLIVMHDPDEPATTRERMALVSVD